MKEEKYMIKKTDTIQEIINKKPKAAKIMLNKGMHCLGCHTSAFETLKQGAESHGISKKEIDQMVKDINQVK